MKVIDRSGIDMATMRGSSFNGDCAPTKLLFFFSVLSYTSRPQTTNAAKRTRSGRVDGPNGSAARAGTTPLSQFRLGDGVLPARARVGGRRSPNRVLEGARWPGTVRGKDEFQNMVLRSHTQDGSRRTASERVAAVEADGIRRVCSTRFTLLARQRCAGAGRSSRYVSESARRAAATTTRSAGACLLSRPDHRTVRRGDGCLARLGSHTLRTRQETAAGVDRAVGGTR